MVQHEDMWSRPLTRRDLLRGAGRGGLAALAAAALAACGIQPKRPEQSRPGKTLPPLAHQLIIAQWPYYIDRKTIPNFTDDTGIDVRYKEVISDNQEFFAVVSQSLSAGEATGYDLIALSDWVVAKMNRLQWLEPLDRSLLPTVEANLRDEYRDPSYDPGNAHSVPWQGGITGIGYNPELTGRPLTSFAELWDQEFAGHVGMLTEMIDTMSLTLLSLGIDPATATLDDARRAQERLLEQRDAGIVRGYYGNDYIDGLARGDLWASMAWSGDVFFLKQDNPKLEFVIPEEGGISWVTPLEVPVGAEHPRDAHAFLDYVYQPEVAADITSWVGYISPVPAVRDVLLDRAATSKAGRRAYLEALATSPLVFPDEATLGTLHTYQPLTEEQEQGWNDLFQEVVQS
jgi:spermidine/putrescine transport system substrate-binding protein